MGRRNEEQCVNCHCYFYNLEKNEEVFLQMKEAGDMECTLDQFPYTDILCKFFQRIEGKKKH